MNNIRYPEITAEIWGFAGIGRNKRIQGLVNELNLHFPNLKFDYEFDDRNKKINTCIVKSEILNGKIEYSDNPLGDPHGSTSSMDASFYYTPEAIDDQSFRKLEKLIKRKMKRFRLTRIFN